MTHSLYHQEIGRNLFSISKIKPFVNNINWKSINFPPQEQNYKISEMNNKSIALNILKQTEKEKEKISQSYNSQFNKTRENQVILLIMQDDECNSRWKQHYFFVKNLTSLLKPLNDCSEHCFLDCLRLFRTKQKLKQHQVTC